ncbi:MAG TPA: HAD family acid phosphatase [Rhizomicrobium sp.]|jgi:5'-nucleotidase (lipoprotein e(P4) family)|nr:HAD family acid phosphatase [Rhizomicrobium sp.]
MKFRILVALFAFCLPAGAAPLTYDCQARMTRVETVPPIDPADANPWQCKNPMAKTPNGTHWQRNALEYCQIARSQYGDALDAARRMAKKYRAHRWVVLMDADETVLDNSLFERARNRCGSEFQDAQWESWVKAGIARDVPGAALFTQTVRRLGGLVAIVTNRKASDDAITRATLKKAGIAFDTEIGMGDGSDKTTRWRAAVAKLRAMPAMFIGDQMSDLAVLGKDGAILRAMNQTDRGTGIGVNLFLLPNPMYGAWQDNPDN